MAGPLREPATSWALVTLLLTLGRERDFHELIGFDCLGNPRRRASSRSPVVKVGARRLFDRAFEGLFGVSHTGSIVLAIRPTQRCRPAVRAWLLAGALVSVCGCSDVLGPRASLGPGAIVRGRGLYNEVITTTNNQQTLELIVRARYGEPAGLLSVASVTANLRAAASTGAQFGIGPSSNYSGNLVPLSLGFAYEEHPTIAYTTVQGERYAEAILSPVGLDLLVLLAGSEHASARLTSVLVKQVNGLQNPLYDPPEARTAFEQSIALFQVLIGMRLVKATPQGMPTLTIPVAN